MRKIALAVVAVALAMPSVAAMADNDVGCGLGTMIWEGHSGLGPKVFAATTNQIGSQTFAISSGTLGCSNNGTVTASAQLSMFASANLNTLAGQMASGHGEDLNVMAELYGIHSTRDKQAFFSMTQRHFGQIFPNASVTTGEVLSSIRHLMTQNPQLSRYVKKA